MHNKQKCLLAVGWSAVILYFTILHWSTDLRHKMLSDPTRFTLFNRSKVIGDVTSRTVVQETEVNPRRRVVVHRGKTTGKTMDGRSTKKPKPLVDKTTQTVLEKTTKKKMHFTTVHDDPHFYRGHLGVDITVVTLYINIGKFSKRSKRNTRNSTNYINWMKTWAWLNNTVYFFSDDQAVLDVFSKYRAKQPADRTHVTLVNRSELPVFKNLDTVTRIYSRWWYPHYYPNTENPLYSLTMYAKWDVLDTVLSTQNITTKYICWMDIGYFRYLIELKQYFKLEVPPHFNDSSVSFSKISNRPRPNTTPWIIIKNNRAWVAGGFFVATLETMRRHIKDFRSGLQDLLDRKLSSTDQQVLAALMTRQLNIKLTVDIKANTCRKMRGWMRSSPWFCLGFKCLDAAAVRDWEDHPTKDKPYQYTN